MLQTIRNFTTETQTQLQEMQAQGGHASKQADMLSQKLAKMIGGIETLVNGNATLTIGVVGQMKAGKSTFLNALMFNGQKILPTAVTPMTAGLTIIEYVENKEEQKIEVEYYTSEEWKTICNLHEEVNAIKDEISKNNIGLTEEELEIEVKNQTSEETYACYELVKSAIGNNALDKIGQQDTGLPFNDARDLEDKLYNYVGSGGQYTSAVKALHIYLNNKLLTYKNKYTGATESYRIVDTPGVNDPIYSRQLQTERFLQEAHAVLLLTKADTFLRESEINFANKNISQEGISKVLVVANQLDILFLANKHCPNSLDDAVAYSENIIEEQYDKVVSNFKHKPIGVICTSGLAENIRLKRCNNLDDDEQHILGKLKEKFPNDFNDDQKVIESSLDYIANFATIEEDYIQKEFLEKKDSIIKNKVDDYLTSCHSSFISLCDSIIKEIKDELALNNDYSLNDINAQITALDSLKTLAVPMMQIRILEFIMNLSKNFIPTLFQIDLQNYKPKLSNYYYTYKSVPYSRKGTFWGGKKSGSVSVNIVDTYSVPRDEEAQIDILKNEIHRKWTEKYNGEEKKLNNDLLKALQEIVTQNTTLNINTNIYEIIIRKCIVEKLAGKGQLILDDESFSIKKDLNAYISDEKHTKLTTAFDEMDDDTAQLKIKEEAKTKLDNFKNGMDERNQDIYNKYRTLVTNHSDDITKIMMEFSKNLTSSILDELGKIKGKKQQQGYSIEQTRLAIEARKKVIENIKKNFEEKWKTQSNEQ